MKHSHSSDRKRRPNRRRQRNFGQPYFQQSLPDANAWMESWDAFVSPAMESWGQMWDEALDTMRAPAWSQRDAYRRDYSSKKGCDCGCSCGSKHDRCKDDCYDNCQCDCCIVNADLVVYAYPGESRLIPIAIENNTRREKEVKLELSPFEKVREEDLKIQAKLVGDAAFKLPACESHEIMVFAQIGGATSTDTKRTNEPFSLDRCRVCYADLRVIGCDIRPIRIAIAILPFDCDRYTIDCACGCC